jgi:hypothetical protein
MKTIMCTLRETAISVFHYVFPHNTDGDKLRQLQEREGRNHRFLLSRYVLRLSACWFS